MFDIGIGASEVINQVLMALDINSSSETVWPIHKKHCYYNNSMNKKLEAAKKWLKSRDDK